MSTGESSGNRGRLTYRKGTYCLEAVLLPSLSIAVVRAYMAKLIRYRRIASPKDFEVAVVARL
jgi:hypothetical protein